MIQTEKKAAWVMLLCAVFWSIGGIFIKLIPWNALVIAGVRSLIAAGILLIYIHRTGVRFVLNRYSLASGAAARRHDAPVRLRQQADHLRQRDRAAIYRADLRAHHLRSLFQRKTQAPRILSSVPGLCRHHALFLRQPHAGRHSRQRAAILSGVSFASTMVISPLRQRLLYVRHPRRSFPDVACRPSFFFSSLYARHRNDSGLYVGARRFSSASLTFFMDMPSAAARRFSAPSSPLRSRMLNPVWVFLFDGETPGIFALFGAVIVISAVAWRCLKEE